MRAYERLLALCQLWHPVRPHIRNRSIHRRPRRCWLLTWWEEMKKIGIADAFVDDQGLCLRQHSCHQGQGGQTVIGFIAHMDTAEMLPVTTSGQR